MPDVTRGLVSKWTWESDYSDSVGTNDGTNSGMLRNSASAQVGDYSLASADGNDYVDCGSDASLQNSPFSFSIWVMAGERTSGTTNIQTFAAKDDDYTDRLFWLVEWDGSWVCRVGSNGTGIIGPTPSLFSWQHLCVTYDGTTFEFYVDGTSQGTATESTVGGAGHPLLLGAESAGNREIRQGARIDEARMYDVELTSSEVTDLYNWDGSAPSLTTGVTVPSGAATVPSATTPFVTVGATPPTGAATPTGGDPYGIYWWDTEAEWNAFTEKQFTSVVFGNVALDTTAPDRGYLRTDKRGPESE